ncbi:MAG: hypothetical protein JWR07_3209 [Nevskia sp.]|nr:hypothetical protein [Nevskia sp.]
MRNLIQTLVKQQNRIFELLQVEERSIVNPPIDSMRLVELQRWFSTQNCLLPDSYREFLLVCDGIPNFCVSYSLFGSLELLDVGYQGLLRNTVAGVAGREDGRDFPIVLIGYDKDTSTRVFFEGHHEPLLPNELVVLEGNPGDMAIHESFRELLEFRIETNRLTLSHLADLLSGKVNE